MNDLSFNEMTVGRKAEFVVVVSDKMVQQFSELTGDVNPLHTDAAYAAATKFGARIAHGQLLAGFFSTLVGIYLPGKRCLYLGQDSTFRNPVGIGERVVVRGEVVHRSEAAGMVEIKTEIIKDDGTVAVDGVARIRVLA
ncbi:hypothetical protein A3F28_00150 [Candidatus Uhrbacteria bacterium RIFCSPHIGHO2_12_FULL_57_11]|uniref:MaoC-like domain-containing protein n=3 Tax=Parcubacteria group TaxID=1794811 RepID=A0A1F7UNI7_9BACT|nr:MAG: hypothetical protein A2704_04495 [Candidatus Kaiserbacteria bacterium RIFCSPHIGHO2_01_FULL_54_36b]OGL72407.1 MAG: hypothetical protein A3D72_01055 [Candidatus Uhrbacteria bacterium RIFCSPHIGHO2_02_FULL_57_19]OGL79836.1 MAG: hypothetical protein A3F28_00150 [Candidatus Uhrbacteria bacterium RIFCSPHIGHO2_12_FULL_57_11]